MSWRLGRLQHFFKVEEELWGAALPLSPLMLLGELGRTGGEEEGGRGGGGWSWRNGSWSGRGGSPPHRPCELHPSFYRHTFPLLIPGQTVLPLPAIEEVLLLNSGWVWLPGGPRF